MDLLLSQLVDFTAASGYYTYAGSLTTPTCDAPVTWVVLAAPRPLSAAALQRLHLVPSSTTVTTTVVSTTTTSTTTSSPVSSTTQQHTSVTNATAHERVSLFGNARPLQKRGARAAVYHMGAQTFSCLAHEQLLLRQGYVCPASGVYFRLVSVCQFLAPSAGAHAGAGGRALRPLCVIPQPTRLARPRTRHRRRARGSTGSRSSQRPLPGAPPLPPWLPGFSTSSTRSPHC